MSRKIKIDEDGYLPLPEGIIEKYGEEFRVVGREKVIELKPIQTEDQSDN